MTKYLLSANLELLSRPGPPNKAPLQRDAVPFLHLRMDEETFLETFSAAGGDARATDFFGQLSARLYSSTARLLSMHTVPLDDLLANGIVVLLLLLIGLRPLLSNVAALCSCLCWRPGTATPATPRMQPSSPPSPSAEEPSASLSPSPKRAYEQRADPEVLHKIKSPFHDKPAKLIEMLRENFAKETVIEAAKAIIEYTGGEGRGSARVHALSRKSTSVAARVAACIDADVIPHLVFALLHNFARESETLTEHVARALRNISFDERGAAECSRAGAPEALCFALKIHGRTETSVCVEGASAIYNIAYFAPASRTGIIEHGAVPLLVDMIVVHGGVVADVSMFASKAIRSLAMDGRFADIFKGANAAAALVRAFESLRARGNLDGLLEVRQEMNRALRSLNHIELS